MWRLRVKDLLKRDITTSVEEQSNKLLFTYKSPYFESSIDIMSNDKVGIGLSF